MIIFQFIMRILIFCLCSFLIWILYINPKHSSNMTGRNRGRILFLVTIFLVLSVLPGGLDFQSQIGIVSVVYLLLFGVIKIIEIRRD